MTDCGSLCPPVVTGFRVVEITSVLDSDLISLFRIVLAIALLQDLLGNTHGVYMCMSCFFRKGGIKV